MSKKLTNSLNSFFLLHEAVICYSICPLVCVPSIFVRPHRGDGSDLHISLSFIFFPPLFFFFSSLPLFPAAAYKTGFLINSASWVSNCHLPVMKINVACLIWTGRQVFFSRSRTHAGPQPTVSKQYERPQNANPTAFFFLRSVSINMT